MKIADVKVGMILTADGGFNCLMQGARRIVKEDTDGLYIGCASGKHYLIGQVDFITGENLVGLE